MAKPILVIKVEASTDEGKKAQIREHWIKATNNEYHVICVGVKPNHALVFPIIEVHGVAQTPDFGDLKATISGQDLNIFWKRKGGEGG